MEHIELALELLKKKRDLHETRKSTIKKHMFDIHRMHSNPAMAAKKMANYEAQLEQHQQGIEQAERAIAEFEKMGAGVK